MNNIDIMYYEYLSEMTAENQKVIDCLFGSKYVDLLKESGEENILFEGNIISSIIEFIKSLFDKVIGFFKKIINFIIGKKDTNEFSFTPDQELIKKFEDKLKSIKGEDRAKFSLEKADATKVVKTYSQKVIGIFDYYDKQLKIVIDKIDKLNNQTFGIEFFVHDEPEVLEKNNKILDEFSDKEKMKSELTDVKFSDLTTVLSNYKSGEKVVKELSDKLEKTIKELEDGKKKLDKLEKRKNDEKVFNTLKNYVLSATNIITKAAKSNINLHIYWFKSQETILKKFIAFSTEKKEVKESSEIEYESYIYEEFQYS